MKLFKLIKLSLTCLLAVALWSILWTTLSTHAQSPIYVDKDAMGGANNGSDWTNAYTDLQSALSTASSGDEIWVATGVYTPGLNQSDTFTLTSGIALYGGFAATETLRTERDWENNRTILSGDIGGDDLTEASGIVTDTANINGANSYHVVWADGVSTPITESAVLDGFTITAGQADDFFPDDSGGGFFCDGEGGGNECSPRLANVIFSGNWAFWGGALNNEGSFGGTSSPSLSNVIFFGNTADIDGGAMYNGGYIGGSSSPDLSDVTFFGNLAGNDGGAMYNDGYDNGNSSPSLSNVTFSGNRAVDDGGAMYNDGESGESSPGLVNVAFSGNTAADSGGAMYNDGRDSGSSNASLVNVVFSGNVAGDTGGAIKNYGYNGTGSPTLSNVTFSGNSAAAGGAMYNDGESGESSPNLVNVILWGNTATSGTQLYNFTATPIISYSLLQSDTNAIVNATGSSINYGSNILTDAPLFVDDDGADDITGTLDDNLRLSDSSPAIDAGDNDALILTTDLDGNLRFYDDTGVANTGNGVSPLVDMGAYEKHSSSPVTLYLPIVTKGD